MLNAKTNKKGDKVRRADGSALCKEGVIEEIFTGPREEIRIRVTKGEGDKDHPVRVFPAGYHLYEVYGQSK